MAGKPRAKSKTTKIGSLRVVPSATSKPTSSSGKKGVLKWIKRVNKRYAVLGGLLLMAISLPLTAYLISRQSQLFVGKAAGNSRPYFSSITPKSGGGDTLTLVTTVRDSDGVNTLNNISVWMDNTPPVSLRTAASARGALIQNANGTTGWKYWGWAYNGNTYTCDDGSKAEACWMNYSVNVGGLAPSDNSANKIYTGGSYSDSTSSSGGRTAEWKVRSIATPDASTLQIVWEFKFYSNFPTENVYIYFHADDNSGGTGAWHNATDYWTREGTGTWNTKASTNRPPVITSTPPTRIKVGSLYRYEIVATDADGDTLSYTATAKPGWLSISGKVLSGTPADKHIGNHSVTVVVSDGKASTKQAFTVTVYKPAPKPPSDPIDTNEPPAVSVTLPTAESVFRGAGNIIAWQASDADGIASISLHYSLDGENWTAISENFPGNTTEFSWDVSEIISGKYYVRVTATDANSSPMHNTATSAAFSIDNNPTGTNEPQIRGVQPGEGDMIENTTPTISASYTSGNVEIDTNSVVMKLDDEVVQATILSSSCHYTPESPLSTGSHKVGLYIQNVAGVSASKEWSFTVLAEVSPEDPTIGTREVINIPILNIQVAKPLGIALIICLVLGLVVLLVVVTIKLIRSLKKPDDEMDIPQYYADYGEGTGPDFIEPGSEPGASVSETPGSDMVEGDVAVAPETVAGTIETPSDQTVAPAEEPSEYIPPETSNLPADSSAVDNPPVSGLADATVNDPFSKDFPTNFSPEISTADSTDGTEPEVAGDLSPADVVSPQAGSDEIVGGSDGGDTSTAGV